MRLVDAWVVTRYDHADAMLRDHKRFSNEGRRFYDTGLTTILDLDPPDHARLRALVSRAFTPRSVSRWEGRVQEIADRLLDAVTGDDRFDLIAALGYPLPVTVIAEMLGVPAGDMDRFEGWSNDIALTVEPILAPGQVENVRRATGELFAYFETIVEARRREPRDDLVSALLAAEEEGDRLTREELLSTMLLILVAGNETTRNLIGQRHAGPAPPSRPVAAPARRSRAARAGRRRAAALRQPRPARRAGRPGRPWSWAASVCARVRRRSPCSAPRTGTRQRSRIPTRSTSGAGRRAIFRSGAAFTTASARRWRCWRRASPSGVCSIASPRSASRPSPATGTASCFAASRACGSRSSGA